MALHEPARPRPAAAAAATVHRRAAPPSLPCRVAQGQRRTFAFHAGARTETRYGLVRRWAGERDAGEEREGGEETAGSDEHCDGGSAILAGAVRELFLLHGECDAMTRVGGTRESGRGAAGPRCVSVAARRPRGRARSDRPRAH